MDTAQEKFCAAPDCRLHVTSRDSHVDGHGDWAELADGTIIGRELVDGVFYCHVCAADRRREASNSR